MSKFRIARTKSVTFESEGIEVLKVILKKGCTLEEAADVFRDAWRREVLDNAKAGITQEGKT